MILHINYCMKKCKNRKKRGFAIFLILFFVLVIALYSSSNRILIKIGESSFQGVLSTASYYAIEESLSIDFSYDNLYKIHKDTEGNIAMITADAYKFNTLTTLLASSVGEYLTNYINQGVDVPIGVFTGISMVQGFGKKIKMKLIAINSVKCDVVSRFETAGINQTRHTLYLDVTPDIAVITRFSTKKLIDKITIMLYDNVIIGKVPEIYLSGTVFTTQKFI